MRAFARWWSVWVGVALALAGCASPTPAPTLAPQPTATPAPTAAPTPLPKKPLALTILHTNDVEGFLNPCG